MKSIYLVVALGILTIIRSFAQAGSSPTSTKSSGNSNRMQELYDEHHGLTPKRANGTRPQTEQQAHTSAQPTDTNTDPVKRTASTTNMSGTRIGFRAGVTYPFFTETTSGTDPAVNFVGGVTFNVGGGPVSFQPEINYSRNASKVTAFGYTDTRAYDALEIPLFVKFSTGTYAGNRFFVNVGPYASYKLNASLNGKTTSIDGEKGRFSFGGALGIGTALKAGPGHVTIDVRGLYPLGNTDNGFNTDSKISTGQGTIGYVFPLGSR